MSLQPWFLQDLVEFLGGDEQGRGERQRPDLAFGTGCFSLLKCEGLMEEAAHTQTGTQTAPAVHHPFLHSSSPSGTVMQPC